jgi:hypothetical protein
MSMNVGLDCYLDHVFTLVQSYCTCAVLRQVNAAASAAMPPPSVDSNYAEVAAMH